MNCYTHSFRRAECRSGSGIAGLLELVQEKEAVRTGTDNGNCKNLQKILSAIGNSCL
jgi:hypothetical protein